MPPFLALVFCILFVFTVFIIDSKRERHVSGALWVPTFWLLIIGSRTVSEWLNLTTIRTAEDILEGDPINRAIFIATIAIGMMILMTRGVKWEQIFRRNVWLLALIVYGGISIIWSDYPFVSFKRWNRQIGHIVMILIVLTEPNPFGAIKMLLRRCAYVLIPLSIIFIKYYPELGILYDPWTGQQLLSGVATSKNMLGILCMVSGYYFISNVSIKRNRYNPSAFIINIVYVLMVLWLLIKVDSMTSLICLILASSIYAVLKYSFPRNSLKPLGVIFLGGLAVGLIAFGYSGDILGRVAPLVGRDTTLTGRIGLWKELLDLGKNGLIGTGFESFWLGDRLTMLWTKHWWHPNEAHNGYLEMYLNLGLIGLFLLIGFLISTWIKTVNSIVDNFDYKRFRLGFLMAVMIYGITESAFRGSHLAWFTLLLLSVEYPVARSRGLTLERDDQRKKKGVEPLYGG